MTPDIALVLAILAISMALFVTEKLPMDLVALLVLATLAVSGLVSPAEAFAGFSNAAVVTVWAMFILSAGLTRTGIAAVLGRHVLRLAGNTEGRMIVVIMLTAGVLSAFMNNIGVAALMLPVVMDIARKTGRPPSRLLMPLAYASLLGGLTTLIGTPPNLLVSDALRQAGLAPFRLFDFTPVGGSVMAAGILFIALAARRFLPARDLRAAEAGRDLRSQYALGERAVVLHVPTGSVVVDKTIAESRLGSAAGLAVIGLIRDGKTRLAPGPRDRIEAGDRLLVQGQLDRFESLRAWQDLEIEDSELHMERLESEDTGLAEVRLPEGSELIGRTLHESEFRERFGANVLAIRRVGRIQRANLQRTELHVDDRLLVQADHEGLEALARAPGIDELKRVAAEDLAAAYHLHERLFQIRVPLALDGVSLSDSRLGDAFGLRILEILHEGRRVLIPSPDETLCHGDSLLVAGRREDLEALRGIQQLEVDEVPAETQMEDEEIGLSEVALAPRSAVVGRSLRQLGFREKFGLQVIAIWREGHPLRSNLRDRTLRFGDALLLLGPREKRRLLAHESDFIVLTGEDQPAARVSRAPRAALIMLLVVTPVLLGWLPIAIAAVAGAALMVLTRCLTMEEAYKAIEWRAIFLIAGMLPLGVAMQQTGAASLLSEGVAAAAGPFGPWGILVALYLLTAAATMIIPTSALVVLMAPIVLKTAATAGLSPHAGMMAIAMAASASFTSPISHPANVLVMGPGGYRFADYLKLGVPLTLVVMIVTLIVLPIFWSL